MHYKADKGLPITIFRPSIITSSEVEPFPGFIDNFNGPVGLVSFFVVKLQLKH